MENCLGEEALLNSLFQTPELLLKWYLWRHRPVTNGCWDGERWISGSTLSEAK
jgi:hypothetical protein